MMNNFIFYISMLILVISNLSFKWPVKKGRITSTFGESRWNHFHDGIDVVSSDDTVYPLESGKLLFLWDKKIFPLDNYPGVGNYKVIKHSGEFYSFYMHLEDGSSLKMIYTKNDPVGRVGNTGRSFGKHLHFSIIDLKMNKSINPFMELKEITDTKSPSIGNIHFKINDKYVMIRNGSKIRLTKHYPVLIKIDDSIRNRERVGIFKLYAAHNDKKILDINFKNIVFSGKHLTIDGYTFDDIYDRRGFYKLKNIHYITGKNIIKILAVDFAGNETEREFEFEVKLDIK